MIKAKALCAVPDIHTPETLLFPHEPVAAKAQEVQPAQSTVTSPTAGINRIIAKNQDFTIDSYGKQNPIAGCITNLSFLLVQKDALMKPFIRKLRQQYIEQQKAFSFSLAGWTSSERKEIYEIFSEELCGVVESVYFDRNCNVITGNLVFSTSARKFLTGEYMEIGVYEIIRQAMDELAAQYRSTYQLYRNVVVSARSGRIKNEFDIVIECRGNFYVVEVKSGVHYNSWGGLLEVGKTYGIVPHRLLLVDSYLTEEKAGRIEHFCEYYVSNLEQDMLRNKVMEMVGSDLRKENA